MNTYFVYYYSENPRTLNQQVIVWEAALFKSEQEAKEAAKAMVGKSLNPSGLFFAYPSSLNV